MNDAQTVEGRLFCGPTGGWRGQFAAGSDLGIAGLWPAGSAVERCLRHGAGEHLLYAAGASSGYAAEGLGWTEGSGEGGSAVGRCLRRGAGAALLSAAGASSGSAAAGLVWAERSGDGGSLGGPLVVSAFRGAGPR